MAPVSAYLAGLVTLPVLWAASWFVLWGFSKDSGLSTCSTPGCPRRAMEPGEHFNVTVWLNSRWHEWITNRPGSKHRRHVMDYWRVHWDKGFPVHPRVRKWLEKQDRKEAP